MECQISNEPKDDATQSDDNRTSKKRTVVRIDPWWCMKSKVDLLVGNRLIESSLGAPLTEAAMCYAAASHYRLCFI